MSTGPENTTGLVWEEIAVKAIAKTVDGPRGPVPGAMVWPRRET
jgi:hypothetical protein